MRTYLTLFLIMALCSCSAEVEPNQPQDATTSAEVEANATEASGHAYGADLVLSEATSLTDLLADGDAFVGKKIRVEGTVVGVCAKRGCWINIGAGEGEKIRFKVQDGEMVFPMSAKGSAVVAEGIWKKHVVSVEQRRESAAKHAKEDGEEFDPSTITEPLTYFQLKGLGAVIDG